MAVDGDIFAKSVKCNGKYRIGGGGAPFDIGDIGFFGKISLNDGCLAAEEDVVADEVNEDEGDCFSVEVGLVADN